jgi:hypothetical protein
MAIHRCQANLLGCSITKLCSVGGMFTLPTTINVTEKCMQTIRPKKVHFIHTSPWVAPKESNIVIEG